MAADPPLPGQGSRASSPNRDQSTRVPVTGGPWNCEKVPLGGPRANRKLQMVPFGGPARCTAATRMGNLLARVFEEVHHVL